MAVIRWVARVLGLGLAAAPAAAWAGPLGAAPADTREAALIYPVTAVTEDDLAFRWGAVAQAAALHAGGAPGGLATVSAEVALAEPGCDLVAAGGQLELRSDDRVLSAQQWASACPLGGNGHLSLDHRLEWDVSPRLLAAPRLRPGLQRRETVGLDFFGSTVPHTGGGPFDHDQGGQARLELAFGWDAAGGPTEVGASMFAHLLSFTRDHAEGPPFTLTIGGVGLQALGQMGPDAPLAASVWVEAGRIEGLRGAGLRFGARLGARFVGMGVGPEEDYHGATAVIGEGAVSIERDVARGLTARLGGERRGWPAWDGRFVVDDRATLSITGARRRLRGRVELAIAASHLLDPDAGHHDVTSGGVTAEVDLDLGPHVTLRGRTEAGRSPYGAGADLDQPAWASESLLLVVVRAGGR